jgi:hypothetical protein
MKTMGFSTGTYSGVLRVLVVIMIGEAVLGLSHFNTTQQLNGTTLMASPTSISYRSNQSVTLVSQQITPSASSIQATSSIVPVNILH